MLEMVEARRDVDKVEERYDLFSGLLDATQDETGGKEALSDDELMGWYSLSDHSPFIFVLPPLLGNMFIFLLAGHEVRSFPSSSRVVPPYKVTTDHSAYGMLLICLVGLVSRRTRVSLSTHKRGHVQLERSACGFLES